MGNKKAQPVPVPTEIEPRYITIMSPYPYYPNLELLEDKLAMARWLACIVVDPAFLHTIWWKPKAGANLVIVEVSREMPGIERLLGEHKWSAFLLQPKAEERGMSSKAYFSHYRTAEHLVREGWKWVEVQDDWFAKWMPQNAIVRYPYPPSAWCDLPRFDPTALDLCLNIPRALFGLAGKQVLPKAATLVPGSPAWVAAGRGEASAQAQPKKKTAVAAPPKNAWNKPLVSATSSKAATPKMAATPLDDDDPAGRPMGLTGPGLTEANVKQHLRWSDEVEEEERIALEEKEAAAGPLSAGQLATVWPPPPPPKAVSQTSGGSEDALITPVGDDDNDEDDGHDGPWYGAYGLPVLSPEDHKDAVAPAAPRTKDTAGYAGGVGRDELEKRGWTCPTHGPLKNCQIGICEEARAAKRRFEREENPWRPRDNLAQWSVGGQKMEVRAVGGGGGGRGGEGAWRTASHSKHSKSASRPPNGNDGGVEGGAWRSKSAVRVR